MTDDIPAHILAPHDLATTHLAVSPTLLDQNPVAVYSASLSEAAGPTMRAALNTIAGMLGVPEHRDSTGIEARCLNVPWAALRYQDAIVRPPNSGIATRQRPTSYPRLYVACYVRRTVLVRSAPRTLLSAPSAPSGSHVVAPEHQR